MTHAAREGGGSDTRSIVGDLQDVRSRIGFNRGPGQLAEKLKRFKPLSEVVDVRQASGSEVSSSLVEEWDGGDADAGGDGVERDLSTNGPKITKNALKSTSRVVYEVVRVDPTGSASSIVLSKKDILRHLGVAPRDLRRVDPSLSLTTTPPALLVRDSVLLLNLGGVRAIVTKGEMFIFEPWSDAGRAYLQKFRDRLEAKRADGEANGELPYRTVHGSIEAEAMPSSSYASSSSSSSSSSSDDETMPAWLNTANEATAASNTFQLDVPFELDAVEAALIVATQRLEEMMITSSQRLGDMMSSMPSQSKITADRLEELRRVKQVLLQLDAQAGALRQTLLDLLDDDEDVRGMVFIDTAPNEDGKEMDDAIEEEVENLIEYYLQRHETCHSEAERLLSGARDLEESLSVSLSSRHYEVTRMELTLSIASFTTSLGAMIAGIFGMNLQSRLEMSVTAFYGTSAAIVFGAITIFFFIFRLMKNKLIL